MNSVRCWTEVLDMKKLTIRICGVVLFGLVQTACQDMRGFKAHQTTQADIQKFQLMQAQEQERLKPAKTENREATAQEIIERNRVRASTETTKPAISDSTVGSTQPLEKTGDFVKVIGGSSTPAPAEKLNENDLMKILGLIEESAKPSVSGVIQGVSARLIEQRLVIPTDESKKLEIRPRLEVDLLVQLDGVKTLVTGTGELGVENSLARLNLVRLTLVSQEVGSKGVASGVSQPGFAGTEILADCADPSCGEIFVRALVTTTTSPQNKFGLVARFAPDPNDEDGTSLTCVQSTLKSEFKSVIQAIIDTKKAASGNDY
jgi:hypothetical protein